MKNLSIIAGIAPAPVALPKAKPVYEIEDAVILQNSVLVEYYVNDRQRFANIQLSTIKNFVKSSGLNEYCFDYSDNGEHMQDCGTLEIDTYLTENLNEALVALFEAGKVWQVVSDRGIA